MALAPVLTRLYDPAAFGLAGIFAALTALVASVAALGLENAIVIERDPARARLAYGVSLAAAAVAALLAGLLACLARACGILDMPACAPVLASLTVLAASAGQTLSARALALDRPWAIAAGRLGRGAGVGVGQLALAVWAANGLSLIEGALAGQALAAAATAVALRASRGPHLGPRLGTRAERARLFAGHASLLRFSAPQTLLNNGANSAVPAILGRLGGDAAAGAFTLANRLVLLPAATIGEAMRQSLLHAASAAADDDAALAGLVTRFAVRLGLPLAAASAALLLAGPALFALVFGPRWHQAGLLAGLLLAAQAAGIANIPAVTVITVRGWQRDLLLFNMATLAPRLLSLPLGFEAGGLEGALAAWCALSVLASLAVSAGVLARLRTPPLLQEIPG